MTYKMNGFSGFRRSPAKHKRLLGLVHNLKHSANYWDSDHNKPGEKPKEKKKKDE